MKKTTPALLLALPLALAACSLFKGGEDMQLLINKAVVGMPAGDFFGRYGPAYEREEQLDQTTQYKWASRIGSTVPGPMSLDERVCKLSLVADSRGRIASATVSQDNPGRISTSRCTEVFSGKQDVTWHQAADLIPAGRRPAAFTRRSGPATPAARPRAA